MTKLLRQPDFMFSPGILHSVRQQGFWIKSIDKPMGIYAKEGELTFAWIEFTHKKLMKEIAIWCTEYAEKMSQKPKKPPNQPTSQYLKTSPQRSQSHAVFSPCWPVTWGDIPQLHLELILLLGSSTLILWVLGFLFFIFSLVGWLILFIFIVVIEGFPP